MEIQHRVMQTQLLHGVLVMATVSQLQALTVNPVSVAVLFNTAATVANGQLVLVQTQTVIVLVVAVIVAWVVILARVIRAFRTVHTIVGHLV